MGCTPEGSKKGGDTLAMGGAASEAPALSGSADCNDKVDNEGDGLIDFGQDPGCESLADPSEVDPLRTACNDDIDNDGDGLVDFGQDPGCTDFQDDDEADAEQRECEDG